MSRAIIKKILKISGEPTLLFVNPVFEKATQIISKWEDDAIAHVKGGSGEYTNLKGANATKAKVTEALDETSISTVFWYDHGDRGILYCQDGEKGITADNVQLLKDRIVSTVACLSASGLGPMAVRQGCLTYIGYKEPFGFYASDNTALEGFEESANEVNYQILADKTTGESFSSMMDTYDKYIDKWLKSDEPQRTGVAAWLTSDKTNAKLIGDENIRKSDATREVR